MAEQKEVTFYTVEDTERMSHTDPADAVGEFIDNTDPEFWPEKIVVRAYEPQPITDSEKKSWSSGVLEQLLEWADEEHGDPDESTKETSGMKAAAAAFVDAVLLEYTPWSCEECPSKNKEFDTLEFIKLNHPDWIRDDEKVRKWVEEMEVERRAWAATTPQEPTRRSG